MNSPVKHNTGHSFSGSSTKKNTLRLNMNKYTHYAPDGITDCDPALLGTMVADDLSNQACVLALARNKSSLIRVSGGENFGKLLFNLNVLKTTGNANIQKCCIYGFFLKIFMHGIVH